MLEKLDQPYGPGRIEALTPGHAVHWLACNGHDADSDSLVEELSRPKPARVHVAVEELGDFRAGSSGTAGTQPDNSEAGHQSQRSTTKRPPQGPSQSTQRQVERLPLRSEKAYQSYLMAIEESPKLRTEKQAYNYIKNNGNEIYCGELPTFDTWAKYVRIARRFNGDQKNTRRAGRAFTKSVVSCKDVELPSTR